VIISTIELRVNANLGFFLGCVCFRREIKKREVCKRECENIYEKYSLFIKADEKYNKFDVLFGIRKRK